MNILSRHRTLFATAVAALLGIAAPAFAGGAAGETGGLALLASKALVCPLEGPPVVDNAVLLIKDGKIEAIGPARTTPIPAGYEVIDVGDNWLTPGLIDVHTHIGGMGFAVNDLNDMVYLTNPGLRASAGVIPENPMMAMDIAAGVTAILHIPGSGTNMGGQGILLKTALPTFERSNLRDPGSLKFAQAGNPERWGWGNARSFMNWHSRATFKRGMAYAKRWAAFEKGEGPKPEKDIQWEVFRDLLSKKTQVSVHTQVFQVVMQTIVMVRGEFGLDTYIDHGSFDGYKAAGLAEEAGVPAILGPRGIMPPYGQRMDTDGRILGMAAEYQRRGHTRIGFNTDAPVIPAQYYPLQAAMGVRYGFDTSNMQHIRGLTIIPATTAGLDHRIGSLEVGKDADVVVYSGDPSDPRSAVQVVFIEGERVYDAAKKRRW